MTYKEDPVGWRKQHYFKNKERMNARSKLWYLANKKRVAENDKKVRGALRDAIFEKLDNKCISCPCTDRRCLQIDYVNNDGGKHRRSRGNAHGSTRKYLREILYDQTGAFQILCANCNLIKYWEVKRITNGG